MKQPTSSTPHGSALHHVPFTVIIYSTDIGPWVYSCRCYRHGPRCEYPPDMATGLLFAVGMRRARPLVDHATIISVAWLHRAYRWAAHLRERLGLHPQVLGSSRRVNPPGSDTNPRKHGSRLSTDDLQPSPA